LSKADVLSVAATHGMSPVGTVDHIKTMIMEHVSKGQCMTPVCAVPSACSDICSDCSLKTSMEFPNEEFQIYLLSKAADTFSACALQRVLDSYSIPYDSSGRLSHL